MNPSIPSFEESPAPNAGADVLVVDDTVANLRLLEGLLREHGFRVRPVTSGAQALKAAARQVPDIILLDINMPEMDGYTVCERLKEDEILRRVPVLFISALDETIDKVRAFGVGGVDYVTKPFQFAELLARMQTHLTLRRLQTDLERHNQNLHVLVRAQLTEIYASQLATILAMSKLAESRDDDTGQHLERVQAYCNLLGKAMQQDPRYAGIVDREYVMNLVHASPLHDIGKVGIPDAVLCKPGRLTPEEFEVMKTHADIGAKTLQAVLDQYPSNEYIQMGLAIAHFHHEKWDGSGYPTGRSGSDIPLCARIMAIADVYDALTSERCYKKAMSHDESLGILVQGAGTHFDPYLMPFLRMVADDFRQVRLERGQ